MLDDQTDFEALDWRLLFGISILSGVLLVFPILLPVEVRVIVESVGDVSELLATIWSFLTGIATFASLSLAVVRYYRERGEDTSQSDTSGPDTAIHITGVEGDLNLVLGEEERAEESQPSEKADEKNDQRT